MENTGRFKIYEQFLADGIQYMFGNPGSVEEGFLDCVRHFEPRGFRYILALQESIAVGAADGYARATGKPTLVQLHTGVGLGNGIGMLYQAKRGHAPIVVIAGEAGVRYSAMDSQMAADLVGMAKPVTKWAARVEHEDSLLRMLRRAIKMAATPPMGPVFLALPMDILDKPNRESVVPTSIPTTRVLPSEDDIRAISKDLLNAKNPLIIMGDGVAFSGATAELTRLAETIGAPVWGANSSEVNIDVEHPLYGGLLGHMFGSASSRITSNADAVLICGTYVFPEVFPALFNVFAEDAKIIHIDLNAYEIAKNFPVTYGVVADPKRTFEKLSATLQELRSPDQQAIVGERIQRIGREREQQRKKEFDEDRSNREKVPLRMSRFAGELANYLKETGCLDDLILFDEALTHSPELCRYLPPKLPGQFFQTRGGSLGVGIPGAVGIKLARPDKTVIAFTGDGGSLYTIQALWTAQQGIDGKPIDAKFVICNNRSYRLLKFNIQAYWQELGVELSQQRYPHSFEICSPDPDFVKIADSYGVPGAKVQTPDEIRPAIEACLKHKGPYVIDLVLDGEVPGEVPDVKCGQ